MKKVCIKKNEFNTNYHLVYGEEKAIEDGYTIVEIPRGYEDCHFEDIENGVFSVDKYNIRKNKYLLKQELSELEIWFDSFFEKQLIQSTWQTNFKVSRDNYFNKDYSSIEELKAKGEVVRARIKEIRSSLK
jgi:hypothetical protein